MLFVGSVPSFSCFCLLCSRLRARECLPPDGTFIVMRIMEPDCCITGTVPHAAVT